MVFVLSCSALRTHTILPSKWTYIRSCKHGSCMSACWGFHSKVYHAFFNISIMIMPLPKAAFAPGITSYKLMHKELLKLFVNSSLCIYSVSFNFLRYLSSTALSPTKASCSFVVMLISIYGFSPSQSVSTLIIFFLRPSL